MAQRFRQFGLIGLVLLVVWALMPITMVTAQDAENWRCAEINGQMSLNVRSGPGVSFSIVLLLDPGEQIEADYSQAQSADGYNWVPVRYPGGQGWAVTARLGPCETGGVQVDTSGSVNQDGTLDRYEIAAVARSVVLIANVSGGRITATGTGTITTPDGLIVTNAHVVKGSDQVAIGLLNDLNDPPEYRYLGEVIGLDDQIDVALIAIRYDLNGKPVNAASLNLPYIPASLGADEVFRGDPIYIFGYPSIGDDYLVVTSGSIVSVENGTVNGQRVPVWYRTDAEIAPGNSGGLAVNGNGDFVGIPTFVQTEQETGGRLGGIRPAEVALMAVLDDGYGESTVVAPLETPPTETVAAALDRVTADHGAVVDGLPGIQFHVAFSLSGWQQRDAILSARFYYDDLASAPLVNPAGPSRYHDKQNVVFTSVAILPCCAETIYDDIPLFIPYSALGLTQPGTYPLKVQIAVASDDGSWYRTLSWEFITYTPG
jgi:S1-C subfamily serine protease